MFGSDAASWDAQALWSGDGVGEFRVSLTDGSGVSLSRSSALLRSSSSSVRVFASLPQSASGEPLGPSSTNSVISESVVYVDAGAG